MSQILETTAQTIPASLSDEELLAAGAQRGLLSTPDDWDTTPAESIAHASDRKLVPHLTNDQVWAELKRRGLKDAKVRPW